MMKVKAFDLGSDRYADRYTIQFIWGEKDERGMVFGGLGDEYSMSADAHMPNGVCMYAGSIEEGNKAGRNLGREIVLGELPNGVLVQIIRLLQEYDLDE